ncbi:MAG: hypothetical protein ACLSUW_02710 [Akkermansia sp.]
MRKMVYLEKLRHGGTGRPVPQSTPAGPNAGLFLIRETTVRPLAAFGAGA